MTEEWREVDDTDGGYEVSNRGRVRSWKITNSSTKRRDEPLVMKPYSTGQYLHVEIDGRNRKVHQLVLEAFVGERPTPIHHGHHVNNNRHDNSLVNLKWVTHSENMLAKRDHGTMPRGERVHTAKLTVDEVREIRDLYKSGLFTQVGLGRIYGIGNCNVSCIVRRTAWAHVA